MIRVAGCMIDNAPSRRQNSHPRPVALRLPSFFDFLASRHPLRSGSPRTFLKNTRARGTWIRSFVLVVALNRKFEKSLIRRAGETLTVPVSADMLPYWLRERVLASQGTKICRLGRKRYLPWLSLVNDEDPITCICTCISE